MHIYDIKVTTGPNTWSTERQKLVVMTLDLSSEPHKLSNEILGFNERLKKAMPTLALHDTGLKLDHVIERVALELLRMAGVECPFTRCFTTTAGSISEIAFSYEKESAVLHAAGAAVRIVQRLIKGNPCHVTLDVDEIKSIAEEGINKHTYQQYWAPPIPIHWI